MSNLFNDAISVTPLVEYKPGEFCPVAAITPTIRWALETLVIHSVPSARDHILARNLLAKWLDAIEPRVIDRSLQEHKGDETTPADHAALKAELKAAFVQAIQEHSR